MNEQTVMNGGKPIPAKAEDVEPMNVQQAKEVLNAAWKTKYAAYIVLRMWAGLRPAEAHGLDLAKNLNLQTGVLFVGDGRSFRRCIELSPAVVKMLRQLATEGRLPQKLPKPSYGAKLKNARKTAIAYHLAEHGDLMRTCQWAGTGAPIVNHHYSPVTKEQAEAFWALLPDAIS